MFLKIHLFVICYEMYKGHILSKLGHILNKIMIISHALMVTVFHFHFTSSFQSNCYKGPYKYFSGSEERSHPILKYRETVMTKLVLSLAQNDENHFLKWTWKQCFLGIHNNSKAVEIKKILGHFFFLKKSVVLFS